MTDHRTTAQRGYGGDHQGMRRRWAPAVAAGDAYCTEPVCTMPHRWIPPGTPWDLSHDRASGEWLGPSHAACNRAEAARYGNARRGRPNRSSRDW